MLKQLKNGIIHGLWFALVLSLVWIVYANFTWVIQNDVSSWDNLTATSWNDVINNQNYLKKEVENIVDTNTQLTESEVDAFVENNGYITSVSDVPTWAVMAFNLLGCPVGWSEYTPAYGRFIRWIDKSWVNIDPDWERDKWNIQEDDIKRHNHTTISTAQNAWTASSNLPRKSDWINPSLYDSGYTGGSETRPKNIALLYCQKQ